MNRVRLLLGIGVCAALLALGAVACGDDDGDGDGEGTTVAVQLTEFIVSPVPDSVPAGSVTFEASNIGAEDHEVVIIKTDLAADALPTAEDGSVDEAGEGIEVLDEIEEFAPEGAESLTIDLAAGAYVLICNVVEVEEDGTTESHYEEGMTVAFTVTE